MLARVGVDHHSVVERNADVRAFAQDRHRLPLAGRLGGAALGRRHAIQAAAVLIGLELGILGRRVVEDLNLHAVSRRMTVQRAPQQHAAIASAADPELRA